MHIEELVCGPDMVVYLKKSESLIGLIMRALGNNLEFLTGPPNQFFKFMNVLRIPDQETVYSIYAIIQATKDDIDDLIFNNVVGILVAIDVIKDKGARGISATLPPDCFIPSSGRSSRFYAHPYWEPI